MQKVKLINFKLMKVLFCLIFSHTDFVKSTKRLANNALLTCKRRPLSPLVTPFWTLTKYLLEPIFTTIW